MRLTKERKEARKPIRVESYNTGRWWGFDDESELRQFFLGRNKPFYKIMKEL